MDVILPRTCIRCGKVCKEGDSAYCCGYCRGAYEFIEDPLRPPIGIFGAPPPFPYTVSLLRYRGTTERLIHALKYEGGNYLADEIRTLLPQTPDWQAYFCDSLLVPVPLHPRKLRQRGYNQADCIVRAIAVVYPGAVCVNVLARRRHTRSQTTLNRDQRRANMRGAFVQVAPLPPGRRVILVDDVCTSGATLNACARALPDARRRISAFTLAHG